MAASWQKIFSLATGQDVPPMPVAPAMEEIDASAVAEADAAEEPGRILNSRDCVFQDADIMAPFELTAEPIGRYRREPDPLLGRALAVNTKYIAYTVRGNLVRVISKDSGLNVLIKGHLDKVIDMTVSPLDGSLMASMDAKGHVFMWKLDQTDEDPPTYQVVLHSRDPLEATGPSSAMRRIAMHPTNPDIICVASGRVVRFWDLSQIPDSNRTTADAKSCQTLQCPVGVLYAAFSLDGSVLAAACADGRVMLFAWKSGDMLAQWPAHPNGVATQVTWVPVLSSKAIGGQLLLTSGHSVGSPSVKQLSLWGRASEAVSLEPSSFSKWWLLSNLALDTTEWPSEPLCHQVEVDPSGSFVVVNYVGRKCDDRKNDHGFFMVHIRRPELLDLTEARFDYLARFPAVSPIVSFIPVTEVKGKGIALDPPDEISLFCVHSHPIQQYHISAKQCWKPVLSSELEQEPPALHKVLGPSQQQEIGTREEAGEKRGQDDAQENKDSTEELTASQGDLIEQKKAEGDGGGQSKDLGAVEHLGGEVAAQEEGEEKVGDQEEGEEKVGEGIKEQAHAEEDDEDEDEDQDEEEGEGKAEPAGADSEVSVAETVSEVSTTAVSHLRSLQDVEKPESSDIATQSDGEEETIKQMSEEFKQGDDSESGDVHDDDTGKPDDQGAIDQKQSNAPDLVVEESRSNGDSQEWSSGGDGHGAIDEVAIDQKKCDEQEPGGEDDQVYGDSEQKADDSEEIARLGSGKKGDQSASSGMGAAVSSSDSSSQGLSPQFAAPSPVVLQPASKPLPKPQTIAGISADAQVRKERNEATLLARLDQLFYRHHKNIASLIERERQKRLAEEKARMEELLRGISHTINTVFAAHIDRAIHTHMTRALTPEVSESLAKEMAPVLEHVIRQSVQQARLSDQPQTRVEVQVPPAQELASSLKSPMQEAFATGFQNVLLPSFEASTRSMFQQIHATMQQALKGPQATSYRSQFEAQRAATSALINEVKALEHSIEDIKRTQAESQAHLLAELGAQIRELAEVASTSNSVRVEEQKPQDPKSEIRDLMVKEQFDASFYCALSSGDLSLLMWLCSELDPEVLLTTKVEAHKLSPPVSLSLLQQLGYDLSSDSETKFSWIRELLMALQPSNPLIAAHVPAILREVLTRVNEYLAVNTGQSASSSARLVKHLLESSLR
eukprot:gb/GEZN01000809.1/.p1 GENE.gb/GEZN01000809.1/~~gb/GEZN01000809.1/.p1  ORF type:complete len:1179 (+),score=186.48 gb/GEZN01000809.1/:70-3606(+)